MKQLRQYVPSIGLRTLKTGFAVMLAVFVVRLFEKDNLSAFYAGLGALVAMDRTFSGSLVQGLTQAVGLLAGSLLAYLSLLLFPQLMPFALAGLGVILLICFCITVKLPFTATLSCITFLSAYLAPSDNILHDAVSRLYITAIGIGIALILNVAIRPYNNKKRILALLQQLRVLTAQYIDACVLHERIPDLKPAVLLLRRIDLELQLYRSQKLFHRKHDDNALLSGAYQLAYRMLEEVEAICGMDSLGNISEENSAALEEMGIAIPASEISARKCAQDDSIVMNYHLKKALLAYTYLEELIKYNA
ncbi:MAG: aromatic acid exporter family protein [Oscillospiraceae bacterium]|jgi:uncharacterized membrane protein YgaE (UPF0421/DUF939 family)|nr:aromatic acid exporter family protein [Oscillospiraceae bacterium]